MASMHSGAPRLRVLQLLGNAIVGGMEASVLRLVARLPPARFAVTALAPYESGVTTQLRALGAEVAIVAMPPEDPPWNSIQVACALVKAHAIDVIHAHLTNAHILGALVGRLTGKPVLATVHGRTVITPDLEVHRLAGTHLQVVCQHTYYQALGLGVAPGQLHYVPNGVDTVLFAPRPRAGHPLRATLGLDDAVPLVGFVGRLSHEKGPDLFVRAAAHVLERMPAAHAVLLGDGPLRAECERLAAQAGLQGRVHLAGLQHDMAQAYGALDVVLSTSHTEALPLALLEAQASGVPVVATRVGGVPELIAHHETGLLVSPNDPQDAGEAVLTLLADPARRQRLGAAARARAVQHFALDDSVEAVAALLNRMAQPRATDRRISAVKSP